MVSQVIKGWLQKLFAWWPWKNTPATNYAHPVSASNKGTTLDTTMYTTIDGTVSQPGSRSVAVEHSDEEMYTELSWTQPNERPDPSMTPPTRIVEAQDGTAVEQNNSALKNVSSTPTPTAAQKLEFLRYLVQRGLVNEGFDRGYEPEQYRKY